MKRQSEYVRYNCMSIPMMVRADLKGESAAYSLCTKCVNNNATHRAARCIVIVKLERLQQEYNIVAPVFECACFKESKRKSK